MAGLMNDGGMAEYIISDAENCVLLPDDVSFEQAAPLMCAGVCAMTTAGKHRLLNWFRQLRGLH